MAYSVGVIVVREYDIQEWALFVNGFELVEVINPLLSQMYISLSQRFRLFHE